MREMRRKRGRREREKEDKMRMNTIMAQVIERTNGDDPRKMTMATKVRRVKEKKTKKKRRGGKEEGEKEERKGGGRITGTSMHEG